MWVKGVSAERVDVYFFSLLDFQLSYHMGLFQTNLGCFEVAIFVLWHCVVVDELAIVGSLPDYWLRPAGGGQLVGWDRRFCRQCSLDGWALM